jgi:DNA-nicking Smr family endonuclease
MPDKETDFQLDWISRHPATIEGKFEGFQELATNRKHAPKRLKKILAKQKRRIAEEPADEELDLHGLTIDQGVAETEMFIELARQYKLDSIRIVHGLGPDQGRSLRTEVLRYLKTKAKGKITGYKIEPHNQGAVIIYPRHP